MSLPVFSPEDESSNVPINRPTFTMTITDAATPSGPIGSVPALTGDGAHQTNFLFTPAYTGTNLV